MNRLGRFATGLPLIAMDVVDPFDKYILCEENKKKLAALKERVKRHFPTADVTFVEGSCDGKVEDICRAIPKGNAGNTVLSLCLVDPYDFGIKHQTLGRMSKNHYVDFLVLLAAGMDANRNRDHYIDGDSQKLDEAFGNKEWRERLQSSGARYNGFRSFAAKEFAKGMETLGFRPQGIDRMRHMKVAENNMSLYYLALFSKHERADKFWDQALNYTDAQTTFNFG
jgi:three-Cys-motif partner protein